MAIPVAPMVIPVAPMALQAANDDNGGQFTTHPIVDTHVRGQALSVVYTNDPVSVERSIQTMEQFLAEDKYRVVGFDLEYTFGRAGTIRRLPSPSCACDMTSSSTTTTWRQGLASVSPGLSIAPTIVSLQWTPPTI